MNKKEKPITECPSEFPQEIPTEYDFFKSNSVTDCTGAVPRLPVTDAELDSYLDVYNFLPQCSIPVDKADDAP